MAGMIVGVVGFLASAAWAIVYLVIATHSTSTTP
jgi:hypothetical protein